MKYQAASQLIVGAIIASIGMDMSYYYRLKRSWPSLEKIINWQTVQQQADGASVKNTITEPDKPDCFYGIKKNTIEEKVIIPFGGLANFHLANYPAGKSIKIKDEEGRLTTLIIEDEVLLQATIAYLASIDATNLTCSHDEEYQ